MPALDSRRPEDFFSVDGMPNELKELYALWRRLRGKRPMPDRREMSLTRLQQWQDHIAILHSVDCGLLRRWEFAYSGEGLIDRFGCDAMRLQLRDLERPIWQELMGILEMGLSAPSQNKF